MRKLSKISRITSLVIWGVIFFPSWALAANTPDIVTGTEALLDSMLTWLLILIPVGCAAAIAWHAFLKQMNEGDPAQAAIHNRAMKNALIAAAIGISASGIVKALLAFYI